MRKTRFTGPLVVIAILSVALVGCDKPAEEPAAAPTPRVPSADCTVKLVETAEPPTFSVVGQAPTMDAAEAAAWAELCPLAGLEPGCEGNLPEGVVRSNWTCVGITNFEGTGIALVGEPGYDCTIALSDERNVITGEGSAEIEGEAAEADDYDAIVCTQAILNACEQLGAEGDCTVGETATYRVTERRAHRSR